MYPSITTKACTASKMTPIEAREKKNHFTVSMNLHTHKRRDRVYEPLKVRDKAKK